MRVEPEAWARRSTARHRWDCHKRATQPPWGIMVGRGRGACTLMKQSKMHIPQKLCEHCVVWAYTIVS